MDTRRMRRRFIVRFVLKDRKNMVADSPMAPISCDPLLSLSENFMRAHYQAHAWLEQHSVIKDAVRSTHITLEETYS